MFARILILVSLLFSKGLLSQSPLLDYQVVDTVYYDNGEPKQIIYRYKRVLQDIRQEREFTQKGSLTKRVDQYDKCGYLRNITRVYFQTSPPFLSIKLEEYSQFHFLQKNEHCPIP